MPASSSSQFTCSNAFPFQAPPLRLPGRINTPTHRPLAPHSCHADSASRSQVRAPGGCARSDPFWTRPVVGVRGRELTSSR